MGRVISQALGKVRTLLHPLPLIYPPYQLNFSNAVQSQTSSNNWINFCKTVNKPLTNGTQIPGMCATPSHHIRISTRLTPSANSIGGSCNPAPIGVIPSVDNMPSAKFIFPPNFAALAKNTMFTVQVVVNHLETGWFTNPDTTFLSAPLVVNANGDIMGHSHVVIELLTGFGQTTPTNPKSFVFFKGLNLPAVNGVLSTNVTGGLPPGYYRIAVIHSGANHQPSARNLCYISWIPHGLADCRSQFSSRCSCFPTRGFWRYGLCECIQPLHPPPQFRDTPSLTRSFHCSSLSFRELDRTFCISVQYIRNAFRTSFLLRRRQFTYLHFLILHKGISVCKRPSDQVVGCFERLSHIRCQRVK